MKCTALFLVTLLAGAASVASQAAAPATARKVVFLAGTRSHGYGSHEHFAGCMLLARHLRQAVPGTRTIVCREGWPRNPNVLNDADSVVVFSGGGRGQPLVAHLDDFAALAGKGVGLACLHYALDVPRGRAGDCLKQWIGGYYEQHWSVNPHWTAEFTQLPDHPVARGVRPFAIADEWYYHMRFVPDMENVTPILTAVPPDATRQRPDGPHSGNPVVRSRLGKPEHVAWVYERPDGGRGFGFTGGHFHWHWRHADFRTVVLNGIAWTAGLEIPPGGLVTGPPSWAELEANQDFAQPADFDRTRWTNAFEKWDAR